MIAIFQPFQSSVIEPFLPSIQCRSWYLQNIGRFLSGETLCPQSLPGLKPLQPLMRFMADFDGMISGKVVE
jgi:hypothetical protein